MDALFRHKAAFEKSKPSICGPPMTYEPNRQPRAVRRSNGSLGR